MTVKELIEKLEEFSETKEIQYGGNGSELQIEFVEYNEYDDTVDIW